MNDIVNGKGICLFFMNFDNWSSIAFRTLRSHTEENEDNDSLAMAQGGRMLYGEVLVPKIFALIW